MPAPLKILIIGPESTGKTTLVQQLSAHFGALWAPEFTRQYLDIKYQLLRVKHEITIADILPIVVGQVSQEETLEKQAKQLLFYDAGTYSTEVYAEHYLGESPKWLQTFHQSPRYDLCLLTQTDLPWKSDWQRQQPERREELYLRFKNFLSNRGFPFIEIKGKHEQRLAEAIYAITSFTKQTT